MKPDYEKLEKELRELLSGLNDFTPAEALEVEQFLTAGEYGVAFETLCGVITEEGKSVPPEIRPKFRELAERMKIDSDWWEQIVGLPSTTTTGDEMT